MDGCKEILLCSAGLPPFGAAALKGNLVIHFTLRTHTFPEWKTFPVVREALWVAGVPTNYPKRFAIFLLFTSILLAIVEIISDWMLTKRFDLVSLFTTERVKQRLVFF